MDPVITVVVPVWDDYAELLPRCLAAIAAERVPTALIVVDNASGKSVDDPSDGRRVTLGTRATIGAARNAGLAHVDTPYVMFADADDEIAAGSLRRSLALLERSPRVVGVIGRSLVNEGNGTAHRGIRPTARYRCATRFAPGLVPLLWLLGYQGSITSTLLRTQAVRDAGGFADTDIAEDWHLAARLSRRGIFVCVDESVRIYHRHEGALRTRGSRKSAADQRHAICEDCPVDPASTRVQRCAAAVIRVRSR